MSSAVTSSGVKTSKKLIMDDAVSTLVTAKSTVVPRSSLHTSRLTNILERLSDDRPLSSSGTAMKEPISGTQSAYSRPPSKASLIIQASRRRDTDCQTSVCIEPNLDVEFITRDEISAIQKDREELEQLLQTSLNSAVKMKEKHDAVVQENLELKEALDILESENSALKEQVNELKDMMRELRQLQKEQLMESTAHRTFGGKSRMINGKNGNSSKENAGALRMSDLSTDQYNLSVVDPHFDAEENTQKLDKLAAMFQKLNDACDLSSSGNNGASVVDLIEQNSSLNKALKQMSVQSKELVQFDRECRGQESKLVHDIRSLAEQAVTLLVETEAAHATMKELFDTVEFEPKDETDPYKNDVKRQEREKRRRRPGSSSNGNGSGSGTSENQQPDFIFGMPSNRYPVSPARGRHTADDDDNSAHRLDEHPDEDKSDSEEEKMSKVAKGTSHRVDAIQEEENEDDDEDSLSDAASKHRQFYSSNVEEEDDNENDHRERRRLRFADEQDREEGEQPLPQHDQERSHHNSQHMDEEQVYEEEEEMTEEEYQYYLRLEQEQLQQEEEENRRRRELERMQNDD